MSGVTKPVFLLGATAAGKTAAAIELLNHFPFEIISVDSALIYKGMDIGTAKPSNEELLAAPHRLIDVIDPWEKYSVSRFIADAKKEVSDVFANNKIPLLVGGTMMYYNALENGLSDMPSASVELREELDEKARIIGWQGMHDELFSVDPGSAKRIHPNDPQRIQRALEVWYCSGRTMTQWHQESSLSNGIDAIKFGLFPHTRSILHDRIASRFETMLKIGFVDEVMALKSNPKITKDMPSMRCVGYRQVWNYLEGVDSFEEMKEKGKAATRQLAKRQITWMRKMNNLQLFDSSSLNTSQIVDGILHSLTKQFNRSSNV